MKGITCFFCHTVDERDGRRTTTRSRWPTTACCAARSPNPVANNRPHASAYSPLLDRDRAESVDAPAAPATTSSTATARPSSAPSASGRARSFAQISGHHLRPVPHAAEPDREADRRRSQGAPLRRAHGHTFPGVDLALTAFPDTDAAAGSRSRRCWTPPCRRAICVQPFGSERAGERDHGQRRRRPLVPQRRGAGPARLRGAQRVRRRRHVLYQSRRGRRTARLPTRPPIRTCG